MFPKTTLKSLSDLAQGLLLPIVLCTLSLPALADLAQDRQTYLAAELALRSGDAVNYNRLREELKDYPLLPYLESQAVDVKNAEQVKAFVTTYNKTPFGQDLRRKRLNYLFQQKDWQGFLDLWQDTNRQEMHCLRARALLGAGQKDKAWQVGAALWLHGDAINDACDPIFDAMRKADKLTPYLVWDRMDLLREGNSAKRTALMTYLKRYLPAADAGYHELWMQSLKQAEKVANSPLLNKANHSRGNLLVHVIRAIAFRKQDLALQLWHRANKNNWLNQAQKKRIEYSLGRALSRRNHPEALSFLDKVKSCQQMPKLCELRIAQGVKSRRWDKVVAWANEMPAELQKHEEWGYWKARGLEELGRKAEAKALFQEVAKDRSYFGFMAADKVGAPYRLGHKPAPKEVLNKVAALPGIARAHEFYQLGRQHEAGREWYWVTKDLDKISHIAAARLALQWGWSDRALITQINSGYWDDLEIRFPLGYRKRIEEEAKSNQIEAAWIYAILRQESMFYANARSPVGALGLMQLMPPTAKIVAKRLGMKPPTEKDILVPDTNIRLGSHYLKMLKNQFNGWLFLAIPSYNAGPHRTSGWLPETPKPVDLWIEDIPFDETRTYVERVLSYLVLYEHRLGLKPTRLKDRLPKMVSKALLKGQSPKTGGTAANTTSNTAQEGAKKKPVGFLNP